jgi:hypothetical protein
MPKGLKQSSSMISISGSSNIVTDNLNPQFLSKRIDLQLNPLDNEVFVVTGVKIDFMNPLIAPDVGVTGYFNLEQKASLSTTRQVTFEGIASPSVIASSLVDGLANIAPAPNLFAILEQNAMDAPPATMDYLSIIATNDFFINHFVSNQFDAGNDSGVEFRVYGYRAVADASTYASLVQSELLSS